MLFLRMEMENEETMLKIATWNIERLKVKSKLDDIITACDEIDADILVLTEADERIRLPGYAYCYCTKPPVDPNPEDISVDYGPTERRVIVYTKTPCVEQYTTYDESTAICLEFEMERGNLLVYGSIIGIYGNRSPYFWNELNRQLADIKGLVDDGHQVCVLGDYNCSFADKYFGSDDARKKILGCYKDYDIKLLTKDRMECIDHIAISSGFLGCAEAEISEWNCDRSLSDHKGIAVEF